MRTTSTTPSTTASTTPSTTASTVRTVVAAVAAGSAVALVLVVGPTGLVEHAAAAARALTDRYGTSWVALAGVVALAVVLVRRAQPRRAARAVPATPARPATADRTQTHRPDGRPRLTLVRAEAQS